MAVSSFPANEEMSESILGTEVQGSRSLDSYLENAYASNAGFPWRYWAVMLSLGVANSSDASEILCLSYILSDPDFENNMLHDTPWRAGLLAGSVFLGMLLGGLFVGTLGDWFGRKPTLMVGLICNSIAGILSAASSNVIQLSLLRCVAGLGIGATVPPLFTLVTELSPPSRRGFFVTFCASFWMVGSIYVAVTALVLLEFFGTSWRIFAVACAIPSALGAIMVGTLVQESPRFLAMQGKQPEARRIVNHLAKQMRYSGPPLELSELYHKYPQATGGAASVQQNLPPTQRWSVTSIASIVKEAFNDFLQSTSKLYTKQLRVTTYPLQMVWFALSFGSYGIVTWINTLFVAVHLQNVYFNALLFAFSNLPGNILSGALMDRSGRTPMLVGSSLSAAASLLAFAFFAWDAQGDGKTINTFGIVLSACAFQAFTIAAWNTIDCMTSELFPTSVRSTGMGVCAASGRIGAMVAQFINGALVKNPVALLLVASASLVVGAMTPCLLPGEDMSLRPLEDDVAETDHVPDGGEYDGIIPPSTWTTSKLEKGRTPYLRVNSREGSYSSVDDANNDDNGHALNLV